MHGKLVRKAVIVALSFSGMVMLFCQARTAQAQSIDPSSPVSYQIDQGPQLNFKHLHYTPEYLTQYRPLAPRDTTSPVSYHNGPIVESLLAYTIFWDPNNTMGSTYQNLINRYFVDIGHSPFHNIATQYYQSSPPTFISSKSTFGGTYHDTRPYPNGRGSAANPLTDLDIQNEVSAAIVANAWQAGGYGVAFFVFTAKGVESCADSFNCTPGTTLPTYCAYHGSFGTIATPILYANMPYAATWDSGFVGGSCSSSVYSNSPNNHDADEEIGLVSHEHFETITDPVYYFDVTGFHAGWYDSGGWEIADKCAYYYGPQASNGSNVTLNGNAYLIQREWSNADANGTPHGGCSLSYDVDTSVVTSGSSSGFPGNNLTYTITVKNNGPQAANGIVLSNTIPVNTTFVSFAQNTGPAFVCTTPASDGIGTINCKIDTLANGTSAKWTLIVNVDPSTRSGTTITIGATVSESADDSNPADNSSSMISAIGGSPTAVTLTSFAVTAASHSHIDYRWLEANIPIVALVLAIPMGTLVHQRRKRSA